MYRNCNAVELGGKCHNVNRVEIVGISGQKIEEIEWKLIEE